MADDPAMFACADPTPEIWPWDAAEGGARVVATGRSDFADQVDNSLGFPGIFRGAPDDTRRTIADARRATQVLLDAHVIVNPPEH